MGGGKWEGEEKEPSQVMSRCYEDVGARRDREVNYVSHVRRFRQGSAVVGTPAPTSGVGLRAVQHSLPAIYGTGRGAPEEQAGGWRRKLAREHPVPTLKLVHSGILANHDAQPLENEPLSRRSI